MINLFHQCPACGSSLTITECKCPRCQLQMRGEFSPGGFATLSADQLTFIKEFLRVRGNLSEIERVLGVSYPTIRNKLDEINAALGNASQDPAGPSLEKSTTKVPDSAQEARKSILQKVASGELSSAEAMVKLQELRGDR